MELKEKELELKEKELSLKEESLKKINNKDENGNKNESKINTSNIQSTSTNINIKSNLTKYAYMVFSVSEPKLIKTVWTSSVPDLFGKHSETTTYHAEYEKYIYTTGIQELRNYNEEIKFKYIDEMEEKILYDSNSSFKSDVFRIKINIFSTDILYFHSRNFRSWQVEVLN